MLPTNSPRKPRKWLRRLLLAAILIPSLTLMSLPWLASTSPVRVFVVSTANQALAPSRLEIGSLRFSWFGNQEMRGVVLRDKQGKALVTVPRLSLHRTLRSLAMENPVGGLLVLEGAAIDIERRADGSIDLVDALDSLLKGDPTKPAPKNPKPKSEKAPPWDSLSVKLVNGSLSVRAPELPEPIKARRFELSAEMPAVKGPVTWRIALANPSEKDDSTLEIAGELDHRAPNSGIPPLTAKVVARQWPWSVNSGGLTMSGRLSGTYSTVRKAERWSFVGDGDVLALKATGAALSGDRLQLDRLGGNYEISETDGAWDVRKLDLVCPLGSIKATAKLAAGSQSVTTKIHGQLDLAALAQQLPHVLHVRDGLSVEKGAARLDIEIADADQGPGRKLVAEARVSDLEARDNGRLIAIRDPASLSAHILQRPDNLKVEQFAVKTAFLDATGAGDLESGVKVSATVDLEGLKNQLRDLIDFGTLDLAGKGRIAFDFRRPEKQRYTGRLAAEFLALRVVGLTTEPIARNAFRLDLGATGPLTDSVIPSAWNLAQLAIKTDDLTASTRLSTATTDGAFQIDELRLALVPLPQNPAPATALDPVRLAVKGRFDPATGTLELRSLPDAMKPEPIAIGEEGLKIIGLKRGGALHMEGTLTGDLARIDRSYAWWSGGRQWTCPVPCR